MGLSVYYELAWTGADVAEAGAWVRELHAAAVGLGFLEVSPVVEVRGEAGLTVEERPAEEKWAWMAGAVHEEHAEVAWAVSRDADAGRGATGDAGGDVWTPAEVVTVDPDTWVGRFQVRDEGTETAGFGLADHPAEVGHLAFVPAGDGAWRRERAVRVRTQAGAAAAEVAAAGRGRRFAWHTGCKTQYAGLPRHGGADHFVAAHTRLIRLLDRARAMGAAVEVRDDSGFWEHRDEGRLREELVRFDELVAGVVGPLGDALGAQMPRGSVRAPIRERADFEWLEARGRRRLEEGDPGADR